MCVYVNVCTGKIFPTINTTVLFFFFLYKPILFPTGTYRELGIYQLVELFSYPSFFFFFMSNDDM